MNTVIEKAYAKINLYLDVVGKRTDGFHEIRTIMQSVDIYDTVTVSLTPSKEARIKLRVDGDMFLPTDSRNLAVRAAELFMERAGKNADVYIKLEKRIPVSAGLAGGSSDAAAVLRALNTIYKKPFTNKALMLLASELGSDVPFCLQIKTALCEGRGELITPISTTQKMYFLIVNSGERVSTSVAYSQLDDKYNSFDGSVILDSRPILGETIEALEHNAFDASFLYNIFENAVLPSCPLASSYKQKMIENSAEAVLMSGSGPTVFGVFKTKEAAEKAALDFTSENIYATVCSNLI